MKVDTWRFTVTGGIYGGAVVVLATIASIFRIPGYPPFTKILADFYGPYGYSATWRGLLSRAFWGFIEEFVHTGLFTIVYNILVTKTRFISSVRLPANISGPYIRLSFPVSATGRGGPIGTVDT